MKIKTTNEGVTLEVRMEIAVDSPTIDQLLTDDKEASAVIRVIEEAFGQCYQRQQD